MSALRDLQEYIREDFDRVLSACESYTRAEEKLHRLIETELPPENEYSAQVDHPQPARLSSRVVQIEHLRR